MPHWRWATATTSPSSISRASNQSPSSQWITSDRKTAIGVRSELRKSRHRADGHGEGRLRRDAGRGPEAQSEGGEQKQARNARTSTRRTSVSASAIRGCGVRPWPSRGRRSRRGGSPSREVEQVDDVKDNDVEPVTGRAQVVNCVQGDEQVEADRRATTDQRHQQVSPGSGHAPAKAWRRVHGWCRSSG